MSELTFIHRVGKVVRRDKAPVLAVQWLLRRIPLAPVRIGILYFLELDGVPEVRSAWQRGPGLVRAGTPADLEGLVACRDKRRLFEERFAAGDHCVVAVMGGRIVGFEWFSEGPTHRENNHGYLIEIPRGVVYAYDAYIEPELRNSGFWLRFKAHQAALMKELGKARVLTFVEYGNWSSLKAHLRLGFKPQKRVFALSVLGLSLFRARRTDLIPLPVR
jgi:hypothetical protein